jgi:hypothetical protein
VFSEILKVIPKLESSDLSRMESTLNSRFTRVAKRFGSGLLNVIKGGGIAGIGLALLDKVLNPIKEIQEAIEKTLNSGDQVSAQAKQFNSTSGNLFRLQQVAAVKGIDAESLSMLIQKFQTAVAEAKADPSKQTAVSGFVGQTDTVEAFFAFIQSVSKLDKTAQLLVQQEVFGEKQIGKMASFLQETDFPKLLARIGGPSSQQITTSVDKINNLKELQEVLRAGMASQDIVDKASKIKPQDIVSLVAKENQDRIQENKRLDNFQSLQSIQLSTDKMAKTLEDIYTKLAPALSGILKDILNDSGKLSKSRFIRGLLGAGGKGDE